MAGRTSNRPVPIDTLASRMASRPTGDGGRYLSAVQSGVAYFQGSAVRAIGAAYVQLSSGLLVPEHAALRPGPSDLIKTYLRYSDVFDHAPPLSYVAEAVAAAPRSQLLCDLAVVLGLYEKLGVARDEIDLAYANYWFREPKRGRVAALLRDHATLASPQALLLLMQFALLREFDEPDRDARARHLAAVILAIQGLLGADRDETESRVFAGDTRSALFREVVASHQFGMEADVGTLIAHHHHRWALLSHEHRCEQPAVDLDAAFLDATGIQRDDYTSVGVAIWAHVEARDAYPIPASALASFRVPGDVVRRALEFYSCTYSEFRDHLLAPDSLRTQWSVDVLRRFPILRMANGDLLVLSKRLLLERIFGWLPVLDLMERLKVSAGTRAARRAEKWFQHLCEVDALAGLRERTGDRLHDGPAIQLAFGTHVQSGDAAIEYAGAWVVIEVSTRRLTRNTVTGADPQALERDLDFGIVEKAAQLDSTISELIADESRLTGRPNLPRRRYHAVLVVTEGFPVDPLMVEAIRVRLAARGLLNDPRIGRLHILDQEDLDMAEAIGEQAGTGLVDLLEEHERSPLATSGFKDWVVLDRGRGEDPYRPHRLEAVREQAWASALARLRQARTE